MPLDEAGVDRGDHEVVVDHQHGERRVVPLMPSHVPGSRAVKTAPAVIVAPTPSRRALADDLDEREADATAARRRRAWWCSRAGRSRPPLRRAPPARSRRPGRARRRRRARSATSTRAPPAPAAASTALSTRLPSTVPTSADSSWSRRGRPAVVGERSSMPRSAARLALAMSSAATAGSSTRGHGVADLGPAAGQVADRRGRPRRTPRAGAGRRWCAAGC